MPRQKTFDKKTSTTYALVHRPQNDPLIHDLDAPQQVFTEISGPSKTSSSSQTNQPASQARRSKVKHRGDLEDEFGLSEQIRANEGEAAEHGVFFDDTKYDYMQHLRDLGQAGDATWVESQAAAKSKIKGKQRLEVALGEVDFPKILGNENNQSQRQQQGLEETDASARYKKQTYQDQQDVPDAIRGFQPDMDPRLREVLEALEDEEYVDNDEDIFASLTGEGGEQVLKDEWESQAYQKHDDDNYDYYEDDKDNEEGWESDDTTRPATEYQPVPPALASQLPPPLDADSVPAAALDDGAWFAEFAKNKPQSSLPPHLLSKVPNPQERSKLLNSASSAVLDTVSSASLFNGVKRKKRKGALTSSTGFSMTSSALARTEPLSTLDERFDRLAESYLDDINEGSDDDGSDNDETASVMTGVTTKTDASRYSAFSGSQASEAPSLVPASFNAVLDDFLSGAGGGARGRNKVAPGARKGGSSRWAGQSGMQQLDEVRRGLGPARVKN